MDNLLSNSNKPSILVTRTLANSSIDLLKQHFTVTLNPYDRIMTKSEIINHIKDKEALLCLLTDNIDKEVIRAGNKLKVISNYAVGFNNIDIEEASKLNIAVCTTPGILTETSADLTWALILATTRRIVEADQFLREGRFEGWAPDMFLGMDVYGKTLGIIGMGRIGQAVARRAQGFEMSILYTAHSEKQVQGAQQVSLDELLMNADIISVHTPLTAETRYLMGKREFNLMKKDAYFINTSRGPVVDEVAMLEALKNNKIAGAGLDVYEHEPKLTPGLVELKNVVLLPHIASATVETRTKMAIMAAQNAIDVILKVKSSR
jgi:glyoxylate reductase